MKQICVAAAIVFLCLPILHGQTRPYEKEYLSAVQKALTQEVLRQVQEHYEELAILQLACDQQLAEAHLPFSCYDEADLAHKIKLVPRYSRQALVKLCFRQALITKDLNSALLEKIPRECAERALERLRVNRYKAGMDIEI